MHVVTMPKTKKQTSTVARRHPRTSREPGVRRRVPESCIADADEPAVLLVALRRVAEARGGVAKVAKAAGIERESLYRGLSPHGNPRLSTLIAVTKAIGLQLTVEDTRHG